ncbi:MAG: 3'(2'),5'-bisphosphate nucleotidase CysQ [Alphaproteobacteria bacterium]|nr:3'(2'),5'-bisphosphate nucleotidase CysQ [Alphaproteobacteria bacterium]
MIDHSALCDQIEAIARDAGKAILAIYNTDFDVRRKEDASPVTEADEKAEAVILEGLARVAQGIPVVAEESVAAGHIPDISGGRFWLVDPLDGTKEFVNRNGEFTVNIALVEDGEPVLGVVYAPATGRMFCGTGATARTATRGADGTFPAAAPIAARMAPADGLTVVASRSHRDYKTEEFLKDYPVKELKAAGSSLKLCLVAAGEADMYPRLGRTMEWDIAAGHAVLRAAGGSVTTVDGGPFRYGKPGFENPFFIAWGRR